MNSPREDSTQGLTGAANAIFDQVRQNTGSWSFQADFALMERRLAAALDLQVSDLHIWQPTESGAQVRAQEFQRQYLGDWNDPRTKIEPRTHSVTTDVDWQKMRFEVEYTVKPRPTRYDIAKGIGRA